VNFFPNKFKITLNYIKMQSNISKLDQYSFSLCEAWRLKEKFERKNGKSVVQVYTSKNDFAKAYKEILRKAESYYGNNSSTIYITFALKVLIANIHHCIDSRGFLNIALGKCNEFEPYAPGNLRNQELVYQLGNECDKLRNMILEILN